ncbi:MAG: DUF1573 domain-containing protein [Candidatus Eisenbacteria bacterium]|uniref:DUF1573 domain-containing protein n=1 Tax=Eiseniibacteriota bacterium TaxID=2212470 RepID=A0A956LVQ0_UNCEI|nr:DUF1573 domain-containing protein [Candidatus Eisenbacteria bacterium]
MIRVRCLSILCGLALSLGVTVAHAADPLFSGPLIHFDERQVDFGDLPQASQAEHRFSFSNDGTEPLRIEKIETSCGCTAAAPTDSIILPGNAASIDVTFSTRDFQGDVSKVVVIFTNDPGEPRVDLMLRANIVPLIRVESDWVDFGPVRRSEGKVVGVLVTADEGTDFRVSSVEGGENWVDWKIVPASAPDQIAYRVEATLKPGAPLGPFTDRIILHVHHPNRQIQSLGLRGNVYSYFRYAEPNMEFNTVKVGKTIRRTLAIESDGNQPYRITDVRVDQDFFIPELKPTANGYELLVTLRSDAAKFDGDRYPFREYARLETTDPNQKEIVIPMRGVIRR